MITAVIIGAFIEAILLAIGLLIYIHIMRLRKEINGLLASATTVDASIKDIKKKSLPDPVGLYLSKVVEKEISDVKVTAIKQSGNIKVGSKNRYLPFRSEQFIRLDRPGFIWIAAVSFCKVFWISARDIYKDSVAEVLVRFLSAFSLSHNRGSDIDKSSLIRYLLEAVWSPFLFANRDIISWKAKGKNIAEAYIQDGEISGKAVFYFDKKGLIERIETTDRYMAIGKKTIKALFRADLSEYRSLDKCLVPAKASLYWKKGKRFEKTSEFRIDYLKYI